MYGYGYWDASLETNQKTPKSRLPVTGFGEYGGFNRVNPTRGVQWGRWGGGGASGSGLGAWALGVGLGSLRPH